MIAKEKLHEIVARLQAKDTTLIAESRALGFKGNDQLRKALRSLLGRDTYSELMGHRPPAGSTPKPSKQRAPPTKPTLRLPTDEELAEVAEWRLDAKCARELDRPEREFKGKQLRAEGVLWEKQRKELDSFREKQEAELEQWKAAWTENWKKGKRPLKLSANPRWTIPAAVAHAPQTRGQGRELPEDRQPGDPERSGRSRCEDH